MSLYKTRLELMMSGMNLNSRSNEFLRPCFYFPLRPLDNRSVAFGYRRGRIKFQIFVHTTYTARYGIYTCFSLNQRSVHAPAGITGRQNSSIWYHATDPIWLTTKEHIYSVFDWKSFFIHLNCRIFFMELFYQTRRSFVLSNVALITINCVSV